MLLRYWSVVANEQDVAIDSEDDDAAAAADSNSDDQPEFHHHDGWQFEYYGDCNHYCQCWKPFRLNCAEAVDADRMLNNSNEKFDAVECPFVGVAVEPECLAAWTLNENCTLAIYTMPHTVAAVDMLDELDGAADDEDIDLFEIALEVLGAETFVVQQQLPKQRQLLVAAIELVAEVSQLLVAAGAAAAVAMHALAAGTIQHRCPSI